MSYELKKIFFLTFNSISKQRHILVFYPIHRRRKEGKLRKQEGRRGEWEGWGRRKVKGGNDGSEASAWPNWFKFPGIGPDRLQGKVNGEEETKGRKRRRRRKRWRRRRRRGLRRKRVVVVVVATPTVPSGDFLSVKTADQSLQPLS